MLSYQHPYEHSVQSNIHLATRQVKVKMLF